MINKSTVTQSQNDKLLVLFTQNLKLDRGARPQTILSYMSDLKQFLNLFPHVHIHEFTQLEVEKYIESLHIQNQKTRSIARKISSIKQFFLFLCREEIINHNPTETIHTPKGESTLPICLSVDEINTMLTIAEKGGLYKSKQKEALSLRDSAMLTLLYATGLRVSELISIKIEKCDLRNCLLRVEGKGGKERIVPFFEKIATLIDSYMSTARSTLNPKCSSLFVNKNGSKISRQAFFQIVQKYANASGIKTKISPHTLRHTYATHLLQSGMDLRSLQTLLGHSDLSTTQIYTHINPKHLKEAHKKYHPRGGG